MPAWVYLSLEFATVVLFALTVRHAQRRGRLPLVELLSAAVFGILLEWGDIWLFGTYTYSSGFFLQVGPVPIIIGLCWAMLIYGAMLYSDQFGLIAWSAPFADALWLIILDFSFDAVAIRLRFWDWNIALNDGYFGVPAGNFNAWLYVALGFSAYTRWIRGQRSNHLGLQALAPLVSFGVLLGGIFWFDLLVWLFYPQSPDDKGMLIFVLTVVAFTLIVLWAALRHGLRPRRGIDLLPTLTRWAMHGYFGLWLIVWLVAPQTLLPGMNAPIFLLGMALALLVVELALLVPVLPTSFRSPRWQLDEATSD